MSSQISLRQSKINSSSAMNVWSSDCSTSMYSILLKLWTKLQRALSRPSWRAYGIICVGGYVCVCVSVVYHHLIWIARYSTQISPCTVVEYLQFVSHLNPSPPSTSYECWNQILYCRKSFLDEIRIYSIQIERPLNKSSEFAVN